MTGQDSADGVPGNSPFQSCPECSRAIDQLIDGRCPFCGERVHDGDVTSDDNSPYAVALAASRPGWRKTCRWVYTANRKRLTHLGLLRPSRYSRRFVWVNLTLFAACVALSVFANVGWHKVAPAPGALAGSTEPSGKGWMKVADSSAIDGPDRVVTLWWSAPWSTVAGVGALLATLVAGSILAGLIGRGARRSLRGATRTTPRLRCAVHYSSAWVHLLSLAALALILVPLVHLVDVMGWMHLPVVIFRIPAVLCAVAGLLVWWLWLVRLAQTTPPETRASVQQYFLLRAPMTAVIVVGGAGYGCWVGAGRLIHSLGLNW